MFKGLMMETIKSAVFMHRSGILLDPHVLKIRATIQGALETWDRHDNNQYRSLMKDLVIAMMFSKMAEKDADALCSAICDVLPDLGDMIKLPYVCGIGTRAQSEKRRKEADAKYRHIS
jgi:hypothetical protein